eukprot:Skav230395  [mRNA]  locus=scaffold62:469447:476276:+ [translate_table: standard]
MALEPFHWSRQSCRKRVSASTLVLGLEPGMLLIAFQPLQIGALSQPLYASSVQIVNATLKHHFSRADLSADHRAVVDKEVHAFEDVDFDRGIRNLLFAGPGAIGSQLLLRLLGDIRETCKQLTQRVRWFGHCGFALVGEVLTSGTLDGAAVRVTQDENHFGIQGTNATQENQEHCLPSVHKCCQHF